MKIIKHITFLIIAVLLLLTINAYADNQMINKSIDTGNGEMLNYWLYIPENATDNMPLIVYLHGGSCRGDDINLLMQKEGLCKWLNENKITNIPAYIVFPQLSSKYKSGWVQNANGVKQLIEDIVKRYKINTDKISLTGHSMGGTGTLNIAAKYPRLFSCIAPMSGSMDNVTDEAISALSSMPVWAFTGDSDTVVKPEKSQLIIDAIKDYGGIIKTTVFEDCNHETVPQKAFLDEQLNILGWLYKNKKTNTISYYADGELTVISQKGGENILVLLTHSGIKLKKCELTYGLNKIETDVLHTGDKAFLWNGIQNAAPMCEAYIIK